MNRQPKNNWTPGDYNFICDRTGFKGKKSEMRKEWTGLWVRKEKWEPRHPQDLLRGRKDFPGVRIARVPGAPNQLGKNEVTIDDL